MPIIAWQNRVKGEIVLPPEQRNKPQRTQPEPPVFPTRDRTQNRTTGRRMAAPSITGEFRDSFAGRVKPVPRLLSVH